MAVIKEISLWQVDESTGERKPIKDVTIHGGSPLGEGYIVSYKKALEGLIEGGASYSALRIYIKLLSMQTYDTKIIAQNKYLYEQLGICRGAYCKAIKWLEDNHYVRRTTENGINAFVLNPAHTACGTKSLKPRAALWSMTAKK